MINIIGKYLRYNKVDLLQREMIRIQSTSCRRYTQSIPDAMFVPMHEHIPFIFIHIEVRTTEAKSVSILLLIFFVNILSNVVREIVQNLVHNIIYRSLR